MSSSLPPLTVNRSFIQAFIAAESPCFALGLIEEGQRQYGLLALRPGEEIPAQVTALGFNFGHALLGNATFEVIQFVFQFYGFQTYNVLVNPNNPLVQAVLGQMLESSNYFFLALDPTDGVTAFRAEIGQETLIGLKANLTRIRQSTTSEGQYRQGLAQFKTNPEPAGVLLDWVCRHDLAYLDLSRDRLLLRPA